MDTTEYWKYSVNKREADIGPSEKGPLEVPYGLFFREKIEKHGVSYK